MEAALGGFLGEDDLGGGGTDDSGVDAEETVKALSDEVNRLEGSWRKTSIPCSNVGGELKSVLFGNILGTICSKV